jgi:hypothetical protein
LNVIGMLVRFSITFKRRSSLDKSVWGLKNAFNVYSSRDLGEIQIKKK